jgi:ubiquinone/menaquinone biosynthesis C-methylase UbiE
MAQWKKKRQILRRYNQSAAVYDAQYYDEQETKIKAALANITPTKQDFILDVGCGTALLFPHLAEKTKFLVGIDVSRGILDKAKTRVKICQNSAIVLADSDFLPLRKAIFHAAFAITMLQNTPQPLRTLEEMKRVTKKQATIVVTGLRKSFSRREFKQMLKEAELEIQVLKLDENRKEYIATCRKASKKTLKESVQFCSKPEE